MYLTYSVNAEMRTTRPETNRASSPYPSQTKETHHKLKNTSKRSDLPNRLTLSSQRHHMTSRSSETVIR